MLVFGSSCLDEPDCFNQNSNLLNISFRKMLDGQGDTVAISGVAISGTDSIFSQGQFAAGLLLPVNPYTNQAALTLRTLYDTSTINISYRSQAQYVSEACGERFVVTQLKLESSDADSTRVVATDLRNSAASTANVNIYRCPRGNMMRLVFRSVVNNQLVDRPVRITNVTTNYPSSVVLFNTDVTQINIPLNTASNSSRVILRFADDTRDTLTVTYDRAERVLFNQCGATPLLYNLQLQSSTFENIINRRDTIQDPPVPNFEIR